MNPETKCSNILICSSPNFTSNLFCSVTNCCLMYIIAISDNSTNHYFQAVIHQSFSLFFFKHYQTNILFNVKVFTCFMVSLQTRAHQISEGLFPFFLVIAAVKTFVRNVHFFIFILFIYFIIHFERLFFPGNSRVSCSIMRDQTILSILHLFCLP